MKFYFWTSFCCGALLLLGCKKTSPLDGLSAVAVVSTASTKVGVDFCMPPPVEQKQRLKTIIILDHSGSNGQNYKMSPLGDGSPDVSSGEFIVSESFATDKSGRTRYGTPTTPGTYLNYLANLTPNDPNDPLRFFASVDFNSSAITYPSNSSGFTSNLADFYNFVYNSAGTASGGAPSDSSGTSYLSALSSAYTIMTNDIIAARTCSLKPLNATPTADCPKPGTIISSAYVIVFMSDGSPITQIDGVGIDSEGNTVITGPIVLTKESNAAILSKVGAIIDLKSNDKFVTSVNLHSIYYYAPGNVDASGKALLAEMARAGNGLPYNALSGSNIDYYQFQPPKKMLTYSLADIFVTNASAVWWTDSKFHHDSDSDGLPDDIETTFGTNPLVNSTANNGVSDLVRFRLNAGTPNYLAGACSSIGNYTEGSEFKFQSSDANGLNDCEKIIMNNAGGIGLADSNKDNVPDFLEFKHGIPFQIGTNPGITAINQDGYTTYQKIKFSLPVSTSLANVVGLVPAAYKLKKTNQGPNTCYEVVVSNFPTIGVDDQVRVDILMKSNLVQDNYIYRTGKKRFTGNEIPHEALPQIYFKDWMDLHEIEAGTWSP